MLFCVKFQLINNDENRTIILRLTTPQVSGTNILIDDPIILKFVKNNSIVFYTISYYYKINIFQNG